MHDVEQRSKCKHGIHGGIDLFIFSQSLWLMKPLHIFGAEAICGEANISLWPLSQRQRGKTDYSRRSLRQIARLARSYHCSSTRAGAPLPSPFTRTALFVFRKPWGRETSIAIPGHRRMSVRSKVTEVSRRPLYGSMCTITRAWGWVIMAVGEDGRNLWRILEDFR